MKEETYDDLFGLLSFEDDDTQAVEPIPTPVLESKKERKKEDPSDPLPCPACKKMLKSKKAIPKHTNGCKEWYKFTNLSPSEFNFDEFYKRGFYAPDMLVNIDYVLCLECEALGKHTRLSKLHFHIKKDHDMTAEDYSQKYPHALLIVSDKINSKRSATVQDRFGVPNVFQSSTVKAKAKQTLLATYGVDNAMKAREVRAKADQTNLIRYGATNPFSSPELKAKMKQSLIRVYGVPNAMQSPEVKARARATCLKNYGLPSYTQTQEFKERFKVRSLQKYGTEHPAQSSEIKDKIKQTNLDRYGVTCPSMLPSVKLKIRTTNLANHGGQHSARSPLPRATLPQSRQGVKKNERRNLRLPYV